MNAIKLEVGKTYENGAGEKIRIIDYNKKSFDDPWPYYGSNDKSYREDGRWLSSHTDTENLIKEVRQSDAVGGKFQLESGKYYRTRDGRKAHVIGKSAFESNYPFVGQIDGSIRAISWMNSGHHDGFDGKPILSDEDLVDEWVEPKRIKGWLNIYDQQHPHIISDGSCASAYAGTDVFERREDADRRSKSAKQEFGLTRIACIEIGILEGQGLEEAGR